MSTAEELIQRACTDMSLGFFTTGSKKSSSSYITVFSSGYSDIKIRVSNHSLPPRYSGNVYDFDVCKSGVRETANGDAYDAICFVSHHFGRDVPEWAKLKRKPKREKNNNAEITRMCDSIYTMFFGCNLPSAWEIASIIGGDITIIKSALKFLKK